MEQTFDIQGNASAVLDAGKDSGIGKAIIDGIDNLGNMLIDAVDGLLSKSGSAALALMGGGAGAAVYAAASLKNVGFSHEPRHAAPVTPAKVKAVEACSQEYAIARAVDSYEVDMSLLGNMVTQAFPAKMQAREPSMGIAC